MMENVFVGLLESPLTTISQKKDIIDVFLHVLNTPQAAVNLWYNYDNRHASWKIYEKLVSLVTRIAEGTGLDKARAHVTTQHILTPGTPPPTHTRQAISKGRRWRS